MHAGILIILTLLFALSFGSQPSTDLALFTQINPNPQSGWNLTGTEFYIHGLWPEYTQCNITTGKTCWPQYCCPAETCPFNITEIAPLIPEMKRWWPSQLWRHEWYKHGTCSGYDFIDYFNITLEYREMYPIYDILINKTYLKPNTVYNTTYFIAQLESGLGARPGIVCNRTILSQIEICVNLTTTVAIDCPNHVIVADNCPDKMWY